MFYSSRTFAKPIAVILAGTLACAPVSLPATAFAQPSQELSSQLNAAIAQLDEMQMDLWQAEAELGKTNYELETTKSSIAALHDMIAENEANLEDAKANLAIVIQDFYKQGGDMGLLDLVLSSENIENLVSRLYYANRISLAKKEAIEQVVNLQTTLENNKAILEDRKTEQENLLAAQQEQYAATEAAATRQASYVNQLSDEVRNAIERERQQATQASMATAQQIAAQQDGAQQGTAQDGAQQVTAQEVANLGDTIEVTDPETGEQVAVPTSVLAGMDASDSSVQAISASAGVSSSAAMAAVQAALAQVGKSYSHANDGNGWDCNGLTNYAWSQAGVDIPYPSGTYAYGQFQWLHSSDNWVNTSSELKEGDLVFYSKDGGDTCYHVALYVGDGQVVHSIGYGEGVQVTDLNYCKGFVGGGSPY